VPILDELNNFRFRDPVSGRYSLTNVFQQSDVEIIPGDNRACHYRTAANKVSITGILQQLTTMFNGEGSQSGAYITENGEMGND
jgi:hypothetical protein